MSTGSKHIAELFVHEARSHGNSSRDALCKSCNICFFAEPVTGEELTCSSYACLNFIGDNENVLCRAELIHCVNEFLVKSIHAALALHILDHDRADRIIELFLQVGDIVGFNVYESLEEGEEVVVENVLSRCRERSHCSAVEGIYKGDDSMSALAVFIEAVLPCHLDSALVSLCAAVAEEHRLVACDVTEPFGEIRLNRRIVVI